LPWLSDCRSVSGLPYGELYRQLPWGHALSVGLVVALVAAIHASIPQHSLRWSAAAVLIGFGIYRLIRARHPRWVGMRVGFHDLVLWSFLMASAHGAGLMLVPVLLGATHESSDVHAVHNGHAGHGAGLGLLNHPWLATIAVIVHTLGQLLVAGLVAMVVYEKLGVRILQRAWFNFDLVWAVALIVSGIGFGLMSSNRPHLASTGCDPDAKR